METGTPCAVRGILRAPLLPPHNPSTRCCAGISSLETQGQSRLSRYVVGHPVAELRWGVDFPSSQIIPSCFEAPSERQHDAGWKMAQSWEGGRWGCDRAVLP